MLTIKCDKCGIYREHKVHDYASHNYAEIKFNFGYETTLDGVRGTYHLCSECFEEMVELMGLYKSEDWPTEEE